MKKIFFPLILFVITLFGTQEKAYSQCNDDLLGTCMPNIGNYKFLKHFPARLKETKQGAPIERVKYKITLNKGITYKMVACNASEFPGKVIINLYQGMRLVATSYEPSTKKHFPGIMYECQMSGIYDITFHFEDGLEGCAVGILSQAN